MSVAKHLLDVKMFEGELAFDKEYHKFVSNKRKKVVQEEEKNGLFLPDMVAPGAKNR